MIKGQFKRLSHKATYGPLAQKTIHNVLKKELLTNFGFSEMGLIADTLIKRLLEIVDEFSPEKIRLLPYQTLVLGVDIKEKMGYGKRMIQTKLKPAIITLFTHKELEGLADGASLEELRPNRVARILKEIYSQGATIPFSELGLLLGVSATTIHQAVKDYYKEHPDERLPHPGTIFDLGPTISHKVLAIELALKGFLTREIARRINHDPSNVDKYLDGFERVLGLMEEGKDLNRICFFTKLSPSLVREYQRIIKELKIDKPKT